jgi:DNA-binding PadR family transcriptional regulator
MTEIEEFLRKLDREFRAGLLSLLVLRVVRSEPRACYGYQIISRLKELSDGNLILQEGTIYPILHSLHAQGLVDTDWGTSDSGPPRKYYSLTAAGEKALEEGLRLWRQLQDSSDAVIEALEDE